MDAWITSVLIAGISVLIFAIGSILGWVSFVRTENLRASLDAANAELRELRADLARVSNETNAIAEQLPSAADWSADTPPSVTSAASADESDAPPAPPPPAESAPEPAAAATRPQRSSITPPVQQPPFFAALFARIEASLAGNWLVWLAGLALAVGGGFIAIFAIEAGLFGPEAQILLAGALGAAMIAAGEWLRRNTPREAPRHRSMAPAVSAGAGVVTLYAATYASYTAYELIPGPVAFVLMALVAAIAAALALLHGAPMVGLGLVGAYLAPFLIRTDEPNAAGLFTYVFFVAAAGLAVTRMVGRNWPGMVAIAGGAAWPLLWLIAGFTETQAPALGLYLPAFAALSIAFAWDQSGEPVRWSADVSEWRRTLEPSRLSAYLGVGAAAALAVLLAMAWDHERAAVACMAVITLIALGAAWRREGLTPLLMLVGAAACVMLYTWPDIRSVVIDAEVNVRRFTGSDLGPEGPPFLRTCVFFAALLGAGGYLARFGARVEGPYAAVSAAAPVIILAIAYWRVTGIAQDGRWALAALALTGAFVFAAERALNIANARTQRPGVIAAYALGGTASAAMVVGMALDQLWMSVGFAVLALASAWLWRRFDIPALKLSAVIFTTIATVRLTLLGEVYDYEIGSVPIVNWLLWGYGVPAVALWTGARWFEGGGLARNTRVIQSLEAGALILAVWLVSLQIRHAVNGGDLRADLDSLLETGLLASAWLASALLIRARLGQPLHFAPRWMERVLIFFGLAMVAIVHLVVMNPWWGTSPVPVEGRPIFNALLPAFAIPGAIAAGYAMLARRQGAPRVGAIAGLIGAALLWAWSTLELRRAFHHPWLTPHASDLTRYADELHQGAGPTTDAEAYAYSALWVIYAGVLIATGLIRRRAMLRFAGLGLLALTALKVVFWDTQALDGLWRGLSVVGLGAALMATAVLYQRVVVPMLHRQQGAGGASTRLAE